LALKTAGVVAPFALLRASAFAVMAQEAAHYRRPESLPVHRGAESAGLGLALLGPNRPERLGSGWLCGRVGLESPRFGAVWPRFGVWGRVLSSLAGLWAALGCAAAAIPGGWRCGGWRFRGAWLCWWCDSGGLALLREGFGGLAGEYGVECGAVLGGLTQGLAGFWGWCRKKFK
jgi:hypothetical protein